MSRLRTLGGIATEAGRAVIEDAREVLGLDRLLGITRFTNSASLATLHRLGFTGAGTTRIPANDEDPALLSLDLTAK